MPQFCSNVSKIIHQESLQVLCKIDACSCFFSVTNKSSIYTFYDFGIFDIFTLSLRILWVKLIMSTTIYNTFKSYINRINCILNCINEFFFYLISELPTEEGKWRWDTYTKKNGQWLFYFLCIKWTFLK